MKKSDITTGSIIAFPLLHDFGYGFAKIVLVKDLDSSTNNRSEECLWYVYSYRSNTIPTIEFLETQSWLCQPFIVFEYPILRGEKKIKLLGNIELKEEEKIIPHFKFSTRSRGFTRIPYAEFDNWSTIVNFYPNKKIKFAYDQIKHLPCWVHKGYHSTRNKVTMEWIRKEGQEVRDYYDIVDWNLPHYHEWKSIVETTPYDEVPSEMRWIPYSSNSPISNTAS